MRVELKILNPEQGESIPLPTYATDGSAGLDLRAGTNQGYMLEAGGKILLPTKLAIHIKDPNYAGFIFPRSGLAHKHGIILTNTVGVIDSDYQGEIYVGLFNQSTEGFVIEPGMRIAQLVFMPVVQPQFQIVESFDEKTIRGRGGFGSTGLK